MISNWKQPFWGMSRELRPNQLKPLKPPPIGKRRDGGYNGGRTERRTS